MRALTALLFCLSSVFLFAADPEKPKPKEKHLVEVSYAFDDGPANRHLPTKVTLYISDRFVGSVTNDPNWGTQRSAAGVQDNHNLPKAKKCLALLKSLKEPKQLPESPVQIVTVRCADGDQWVVRRFPREELPVTVREILITMGFSDERFKRLTFIPKRGHCG